MANVQESSAEYNGKSYKVLFSGKTKYGHRTHLGFFDGSKSFWVDTHKVKTTQSPSSSSSRGDEQVRCRHCNQRTPEGDGWCMACGRADYER